MAVLSSAAVATRSQSSSTVRHLLRYLPLSSLLPNPAVSYHWHASMSVKDAEWIDVAFKGLLYVFLPSSIFNTRLIFRPDFSPELEDDTSKIDPDVFRATMQAGKNAPGNGPCTWGIRGITRDDYRFYADAQIAAALNKAIEQSAGAFGSHGSPAPLRVRSAPFLEIHM